MTQLMQVADHIRNAIAPRAILLLPFTVLTMFFWGRSAWTSDVMLIPITDSHALVLTSHAGRWCECILLGDWPHKGVHRWSGTGWRRAGAFVFWEDTAAVSEFGFTWLIGHLKYNVDEAKKPMLERSLELTPGAHSPIQPSPKLSNWFGQNPWQSTRAYAIKVPWLYISGPLALMTLVFQLRLCAQRWTRYDRERRGMCTDCGYDLRGSARCCPECGRGITHAAPLVPVDASATMAS